jgi:hypothetical protein
MAPERAILLLIPAVVGASVTIPKLKRMYVITGRIPGASVRQAVVVGKRHEPARISEGRLATYSIDWVTAEPWAAEKGADQVEASEWRRLRVGTPIRVVQAPGERGWFYRHSIYVDAGNFAFDYALLAAEVAALLYSAWSIYRCGREPPA